MTLTVPVADDGAPAVVFPGRCVGCGGVHSTTSALSFAKVVTTARGTQQPRRVTLQVPHCAACAGVTKAVFLAGLIPFAVGFLLAGGAAFAAVAFGAAAAGFDDVGRPNNANSLVLGAAAGLAAGVAGGFLCELVARVLLWPVFGRAMLSAPLLVPSLFTDTDHVAGLTGRPNADLSLVALTFARDDIGQAFATANASWLQRAP